MYLYTNTGNNVKCISYGRPLAKMSENHFPGKCRSIDNYSSIEAGQEEECSQGFITIKNGDIGEMVDLEGSLHK